MSCNSRPINALFCLVSFNKFWKFWLTLHWSDTRFFAPRYLYLPANVWKSLHCDRADMPGLCAIILFHWLQKWTDFTFPGIWRKPHASLHHCPTPWRHSVRTIRGVWCHLVLLFNGWRPDACTCPGPIIHASGGGSCGGGVKIIIKGASGLCKQSR